MTSLLLVTQIAQIKMKIFQSIQRHFTVLGITVHQSREQSPISIKQLIVILIFVLNSGTQVMSIAFVAEEFEEFTFSIYALFTLTMCVIEFGILIWKMKQLFQFIENFENLIESSELAILIVPADV